MLDDFNITPQSIMDAEPLGYTCNTCGQYFTDTYNKLHLETSPDCLGCDATRQDIFFEEGGEE